MSIKRLADQLSEFENKPDFGTDEYQQWLQLDDVLEFMARSSEELVSAYISMDNLFIYAVLVKESRLVGDYLRDLQGWNFGADSGWGYGTGFDGGNLVKRVFEPLDRTFSKVLDGGEPLFFLRYFDGYIENKSYVEFNQKIAHLLQVHWMSERFAYAKIDELGDFKDVVFVTKNDRGIVCAVDRQELEMYMFLTDTVLVRVFDVTRCHDWGSFHEQSRETQVYQDDVNELYAERNVATGKERAEAAWIRGFQIIRRQQPDEVMIRMLEGKPPEPNRYETFVAFDWKHQAVRECSCDPDQLGNYFVESDLPFSTSPAFFRPEVLLKYQQHPDKYEFAFREIHCRGAWSLRYDINEEGQVHVYLKDLAALPHAEQIYWKSFNEKPKAGISKRALATDFRAEWYDEEDPLESLKRTLRAFPKAIHRGARVTVWEAYDGERSYGRLGYVVTDSTKEWQDRVLELAKLLIEGLQKPVMRDLASHLKCDDSQLGTLKLLRSCLLARGLEQDRVREILAPLEALYKYRSAGAAHASRSRQHRDRKEEYRKLVADCAQSMEVIRDLVQKHYLDF